MQREHVDTDLHVQQSFVDMLRVVFDSECDEELRVGDGVVYECSFVFSYNFSFGDAIVGITIISADDESISGSVIDNNFPSIGLSVDSAVPGQYNVRCIGGDRGE